MDQGPGIKARKGVTIQQGLLPLNPPASQSQSALFFTSLLPHSTYPTLFHPSLPPSHFVIRKHPSETDSTLHHQNAHSRGLWCQQDWAWEASITLPSTPPAALGWCAGICTLILVLNLSTIPQRCSESQGSHVQPPQH